MTLAATSEQENITLYFGDQLVIDPTKNVIFEARLKVNFAGAAFSADQRFVVGLAAAVDDCTLGGRLKKICTTEYTE